LAKKNYFHNEASVIHIYIKMSGPNKHFHITEIFSTKLLSDKIFWLITYYVLIN